ncbi:MAG: LacI family DNA-binding transcriptional regulator [Gemmataceae bacterium]|nr:LacI family DNA-binding transcriptional regulator [Gemmataceae bacterium]
MWSRPLDEVAREAGVSLSTVKRFVSGGSKLT